jgi:hypothetical protein
VLKRGRTKRSCLSFYSFEGIIDSKLPTTLKEKEIERKRAARGAGWTKKGGKGGNLIQAEKV